MRTIPVFTVVLCAALAGCGASSGVKGVKGGKAIDPARANWPVLLPTNQILKSITPATPDPTEELELRAARLKARAAALARADY